MERIRQFVSAILAGLMIGMGGCVYLSLENPVIGAFLFGIGLFTVIIFKLQLFTGKIGYLPMEKPIYLIELGITWVGNLVGTFLMAKGVSVTRIMAKMERVETIAAGKLNDNFLSIFILAIFCGILMFIAIDSYRNNTGSCVKIISVFVPVMVFILAGFEHVVANMYYFTLADAWSVHAFMSLIVMTLGNSLGGMLIPLYQKYLIVNK